MNKQMMKLAVEEAEVTLGKAQKEILETQSPLKREMIASHNYMDKLVDICRGNEGMNQQEAEAVHDAANMIVEKHQLEVETPSVEAFVGTNNALTYCRNVQRALWQKIVSYK